MALPKFETTAALIEAAITTKFRTQVALEQASGISDTSISNWRSGRTMPSRHVLPALAAALEMKPAELAELVAADRARRRHGDAAPAPVLET